MKLVNRIQRLRLTRAKSDKSFAPTAPCSPVSLVDIESSTTSLPSHENAEELAADYLTNLRNRFQRHMQHLLSQEEEKSDEDSSSLHWANYWVQEETEFLQHHERSLRMKSGFHFQQSYLRWRKERMLNFLWMICRDESSMTLQQLQHVFDSFVNREVVLLQLHVVNYICCCTATPSVTKR